MDQTVKLPSGKNFSKRDFVDVKRRASSEISCGFIITDAMLDCVQSDRQRVGQARQLFSRGVSTMFIEFYPDNVQNVLLLNSVCPQNQNPHWLMVLREIK